MIILGLHHGGMSRRKESKYQQEAPEVSYLNAAKVLIDELWEQLRH